MEKFMKYKRYGITFDFMDEFDKNNTQNLLQELSNSSGENTPVVLSKALRVYKMYLRSIKEQKILKEWML